MKRAPLLIICITSLLIGILMGCTPSSEEEVFSTASQKVEQKETKSESKKVKRLSPYYIDCENKVLCYNTNNLSAASLSCVHIPRDSWSSKTLEQCR
jgi:hypothetical protein